MSPPVLKYTMEKVHPTHKLSKTHPDGARLEKYDLRCIFQHLLPDGYVREKEQFSDAVGSEWIDSLKKYAESKIDDDLFDKRPEHIHTKEAYLYYAMFRDIFYNIETPEDCVITEPHSIACSTEEALKWHKNFEENSDPSGDAVKLALGEE